MRPFLKCGDGRKRETAAHARGFFLLFKQSRVSVPRRGKTHKQKAYVFGKEKIMALTLIYKNDIGEAVMHGGGSRQLRLKELAGFGTVEFEYSGAVYPGCDGQKTLSRRALPRTLTIAADITGSGAAEELRRIIDVMSEPGMLYISDGGAISRRIYCNRCEIPDAERRVRGRLCSFTVQFICDSPYFEDTEDTEIPIYRRIKLLSTEFSLPCKFGSVTSQNTALVIGSATVEPQITIRFTRDFETEESITVTNVTTGAKISFEYLPQAGDTVCADIAERRLISSRYGDITETLSDDTYLNDFCLERGKNVLNVSVGDVESGVLVACTFNNKYFEAAVI